MSAANWRERDRLILPDPKRWGRGYGSNGFDKTALKETRSYILETMERGGLPGYENRGLINRNRDFRLAGGNFILPSGYDADGPGRKNGRPDQLDPNHPTSTTKKWQVSDGLRRYYQECGYSLDQHGRAVHPLLMQVLRADIPVCTGYGAGWEGGETVVVDVVVTDGESVLFNTREDHGKTIPSLVGGYTYATDFTSQELWHAGRRKVTVKGIYRAVHRIVESKTGITLPKDARYEIAWGIRPWSSYHTANFWTVTYTVKVVLPHGAAQRLRAQHDAFWQPVTRVGRVVDNLWPDHRRGYQATTNLK